MTRGYVWWLLGGLLGGVGCDSPVKSPALSADVDTTTSEEARQRPPQYWADRLEINSDSVRREAIAQLGMAGREAADFAPTISLFIGDPNEKLGFTAAWALAHIGMAAHPILVGHLDDPDARIRERAVYGLGESGPAAGEATGRLLTLETDDPSERVRNMATWALKEVQQRPSVADRSMTLLEGVRGSRRERREASQRLGYIANRNAVAVAELIKLLGDSLPAVRASAIQALADAGPVAIPALSAALSNRNKIVRNAAVVALSKMQRSF